MKKSNKKIIIRKMRASDIGEAMNILSQWNMAPVAPSPDKPNPERSSIDIGNSFVALHEGNVVGVASYIVLSDTVAETASLAVNPLYQGEGIGYRLQRARLEEMHRRGIRKVHTETDRIKTIKWYKEKFGYREVGRNPKKHDFSLAGVDEWTVLELDLDDYFATGEKPHGRK